ncbi:uncharacterized protein Fot_21567 [Forsythia ovata]|uniref:Uncharacterized protein n=1 Tax=Forsythia ovata TaxID=205694 RepID=A0ABD1UVK5_9LAMI
MIKHEKLAKISQVGEHMTKATGDHFSLFANILPSRQQNGIDSSLDTSSQQDENDPKKILDAVDVDASGSGVLSKVQSTAVDPLYLSNEGSLNMIRGFFSSFRSSIYLDASNYKEFYIHQRGKKRKLLHSNLENQGNGLTETKAKTPEPKIRKAGTKRIE